MISKDEIIRMAREAGFRTGNIELSIGDPIQFIASISGTSCIVELVAYTALVQAHTQEQCAEVAEQYCSNRPNVCSTYSFGRLDGEKAATIGISAAIRAMK